MTAADPARLLDAWFKQKKWRAFDFQREAWAAYLAGHSGLVHAPTGSGKTLAVFGGPLIERLAEGVSPQTVAKRIRNTTEPFRILWVTPLRALASDTAQGLERVAAELGLNWSVELRTSDTSQTLRKKQRDRLPTVLITTPESLSLLISYPNAAETLAGLKAVIVDEWHELLSTKRGVQTELGLARLRALTPGVRTWGLSATLANLDQARDVLVGPGNRDAVMVHGTIDKEVEIISLIPESIERFPWGGHMGLRMLDPVILAIESAASTLVFTNTRAQAEIWFRSILSERPDWQTKMAVHHGSIDRKLRGEIETALREGQLKAVVCTSSLDLGVDFATVEQVIQVGSPKGIARLMQRAGRSGHRPGQVSVALCAPTHAFELIEFSAAREGIKNKQVEPRVPLDKPFDVLAQHLVTCAAGGGFEGQAMLAEVRTTHAYQALTDEEFDWVMDFVIRGGATLRAYPRFMRVKLDESGKRWVIASEPIARLHRLAVGTITSDGVLTVALTTGKRLGTIEESYLGKLMPGDSFIFAGRGLELVGIRDMTARCRPTKKMQGTVPSWNGGRFPLSTSLSDGVRKRLEQAAHGEFVDDEMRALAPVLQLQSHWSAVPNRDQLLVERVHSREGTHHFVYAFLGRLVHEGLGGVLGYRIKKLRDLPVTATFTDYGIELLTPEDPVLGANEWLELLSPTNVLEDLLLCLNAGELTKRQFREVARVAGLVMATSPGAPRSVRQLQASTELFYEVFCEFDPGNLLLKQAQREVLEHQLEIGRLTTALETLSRQQFKLVATPRFTPMAFPIWAQRIGSQTVRVEEASERIERMIAQLEKQVIAEEKPKRPARKLKALRPNEA
ncbi:MAG: putative ATP-dependent helicase [Phycisphaerales bacterium]|nr:putative ATP-dependent helicase [Phycisphaerales bacterium]